MNPRNFEKHDDRLNGPSRINVGHGEIRRVQFKSTHKKNLIMPFKNLTQDDIDSDLVSAAASFSRLSLAENKDFIARCIGNPIVQRTAPVCHYNQFRMSRNFRNFEIKKGFSWYKVTLIRGAQYEKNVLLRNLISVIPQTCTSTISINPYKYEKDGQNVTFFVGKYRTAVDLLKASRRITTPSGEKIIVRVRAVIDSYRVVLSNTDKEAIKVVCCSKRYNVSEKALDLSRFHDDPDLKSADIFAPLSKTNLLIDIIQSVKQVIPDICALNLSYNKLYTFPASPTLQEMMPNLIKLNIGNNELSHILSLKNLKNSGIEELELEGNSLVWKQENQKEVCLKELRKIFPYLKVLDNVALKPVISFDTKTPKKLLPPQVAFYCGIAHLDIVDRFIHEYFQIYDSNNRVQLLEAYDLTSQFSLSYHLPTHCENAKSMLYSDGNIKDYLELDRNLCKIKNKYQRKDRLYYGKENIINRLCRLPKTHHDLASFTVDLTISTPNLVSLMITGIFRERPSISVPVFRAFSRIFLVAIYNGRCCIINELMCIGRPTDDQAKVAFKLDSVNGLSTSTTLNSTAATVNPAELDIETKIQMVLQLAAETGMNLVYSDKCLCETGWNYVAAISAFNTHKAHLPAEAFVK